MSRNAQMIRGLCVSGGVSLTVVGWATGFFAQVAASVVGLWQQLAAWLRSELGWGDLVAGGAVLIVPVIILVVIFAIADN